MSTLLMSQSNVSVISVIVIFICSISFWFFLEFSSLCLHYWSLFAFSIIPLGILSIIILYSLFLNKCIISMSGSHAFFVPLDCILNCLLAYLVLWICCWNYTLRIIWVMHWIIGTEVNRTLVWELMLICLGVLQCLMFTYRC